MLVHHARGNVAGFLETLEPAEFSLGRRQFFSGYDELPVDPLQFHFHRVARSLRVGYGRFRRRDGLAEVAVVQLDEDFAFGDRAS